MFGESLSWRGSRGGNRPHPSRNQERERDGYVPEAAQHPFSNPLIVRNPGSSQGMAPPAVDRSPRLHELSQENLSQACPEAQCFHPVKCTVNTVSAFLFISYGREAVTTEIRCFCWATQLGNVGMAWGSDPNCPLDPVSGQQEGSQAFLQTNRRRMLTITLPTILHGPAGGEVPVKCLSHLNSPGSGIPPWLRMPQGWVPTGPPCKLQDNKDLQYLCWPSLPPTHFLPQRKMKESDNYFYLPPNCTNYQPISSQCDRHQLWKTHRDKLALIGFPLAV